MKRSTSNRNIPQLDAAALDRLALRYVERYATTRAKLRRYLERKLYERGWGGSAPPPIEAIVARFAELGYVNDQQFAEMKAASLTRQGYGQRRVADTLRAAGISSDDAKPASEAALLNQWKTAVAFAQKRRFGPFAEGAVDLKASNRAFAAMIRAGHPIEVVKKILHTNIDVDFETPYDEE